MDPADQVAIHEAMEQQTISITKAGIQATLNARTSILAAANPVFGRYDRTKTLKANVVISPAIMSRFDLFFVIIDECNPHTDDMIARHIINSHRDPSAPPHKNIPITTETPFTTEQIQKYIKFARTLNPSITPQSRKVLVECYRLLRQNDILGKNKTAYRITVRQLESLIRLSEALARLHLSVKIEPAYVREAYRLLQKSIIFVETEDIELEDNEEQMDLIEQRKIALDGDDDDEGSGNDGNGNDDDHDGDNHHGGGDQDRDNFNDKDEDNNSRRSQTTPRKRKLDTVSSDEAVERDDKPIKVEPSATAGVAKKKKTQISATEYEHMTNMIALHLKKKEDAGIEGGVEWLAVVEWYLNEIQEELVDEEAFHTKRRTVSQVLRRMVKHDGVLVLVDGALSGDAATDEKRKLQLHPSYVP